MLAIPAPARALLESGRLAHLLTLDPDGAPQVTCVWVGLEGDEIVFASLPENRKVRNLRRDPRVALSVETDRINEYGLAEHLVVRGRARVEEGGAAELLQRLAWVYLGPDVTFPPVPDPPPGFVTRISVESVGGIGPWAQG